MRSYYILYRRNVVRNKNRGHNKWKDRYIISDDWKPDKPSSVLQEDLLSSTRGGSIRSYET